MHKKINDLYLILILGGQDSHLGGLSPPLPMPGAGPDICAFQILMRSVGVLSRLLYDMGVPAQSFFF